MSSTEISRRKALGIATATVTAGSLYGTTTAAAQDEECLECDECDGEPCPECRTADSSTDTADITFKNQSACGGREVVIEEACLPCGGFIDIHDAESDTDECSDQTFGQGAPLGASTYLEPGCHENVTICLCEENCYFGCCVGWERATGEDCIQSEPRELCAMIHRDDPADCTFTHFCDHGQEDNPYLDANNDPIQDCAKIKKDEECEHGCEPIECKTQHKDVCDEL